MLFLILILGCCGYVLYYAMIGLFRKKYSIKCDMDVLCERIIWWGMNNIPPHTQNNKLKIVLSEKDKKDMATYYPQLKKIEIFLNHHDDVYELVDSLLHEVTNYKQYRTNPRKLRKEYLRLLKQHGYQKHPMEVEANENAKKYSRECLKYLERNGFLS